MTTATPSAAAARKSAINGNADARKVEADSDSDDGTTRGRGRPGVIPTLPHGAVYHHEGRFFAGVFHPSNTSQFIESGKGEGAAKGALEDAGFKLAGLTEEGPEWLTARLPKGATVVGYASVKSFPLPKQ